MYPDHYVLTMLRNLGVPPFWQEDACQEVRLREWLTERKGQPVNKQALRNMGVSAFRAVTHYSRAKTPVSAYINERTATDEAWAYIEAANAAPEYPSDELMDAARELRQFTPRQRQAFALMAHGLRPREAAGALGYTESRVVQLRRRLREVCAA
ncbi:MAG TPA: hypothetical protein VIP09_02155 [Dehalococcoidia bacterium]